MAYTLVNKCAKNLCERAVLLQLIIENVVTCLFWNTVYTGPLFSGISEGRVWSGLSLKMIRDLK